MFLRDPRAPSNPIDERSVVRVFFDLVEKLVALVAVRRPPQSKPKLKHIGGGEKNVASFRAWMLLDVTLAKRGREFHSNPLVENSVFEIHVELVDG